MGLCGFANSISIVTGAASGLGKAISKLLLESGGRVVLLDKNEAMLSKLAQEFGDKAEVRACDVTNYKALKSIVEQVVERFGKLDYFFNNAGIAIMGEARDLTIEDWNEIIDVDLKGVVNGVVAVYPTMVSQKSGHIVNISSMSGIVPIMMHVPYTTSKYGVVGLSHSLRIEAKKLGVKVSVVCPNFVNTPMWNTSKLFASQAETAQEYLRLFGKSDKLLNPDIAARRILKGVLKNKATILNDQISRIFWWGYRLAPTLWMWLCEAFVLKKIRTLRKEGN